MDMNLCRGTDKDNNPCQCGIPMTMKDLFGENGMCSNPSCTHHLGFHPAGNTGDGKQGGNDRFVEKRVTDALDNCVWALLDGDNPIGVCFFVKSTLAVTAQHNLVEEQKTIRARLGGNEVITLSVVYRNIDLDIAVLKSETDHAHLSVHTGEVEKGTRAILSGYSIGVAENLEQSFTESVSVMTAKINKVSQHHLVYQSNAFQGDSGGALVLLDGNVVGMHLAGVNQLKERIKRKKAVDERLTEVQGSIDGIVEGLGQGNVGILCSCISEAICEAQKNVSAIAQQNV